MIESGGKETDIHSIAHKSITTLLKTRVRNVVVVLHWMQRSCLALYVFCHIQSSARWMVHCRLRMGQPDEKAGNEGTSFGSYLRDIKGDKSEIPGHGRMSSIEQG